MTVTIVGIIVVFLGACVFYVDVLTAAQILWVNLIMDTFGALALATEKPVDALLERQPAKRGDSIINAAMWRNILGIGFYQVLVMLFILFFGAELWGLDITPETPFYATASWKASWAAKGGSLEFAPYNLADEAATDMVRHYTMCFQAFVFMQIFNQINARKLGEHEYNVFAGITINKLFLVITAITFVVQVAIVQWGGKALRCAALTTEENTFAIGLALGVLPWSLLIKRFLPCSWFDSLARSVDDRAMTETEMKESLMTALSGKLKRQASAHASQKSTDGPDGAVAALDRFKKA